MTHSDSNGTIRFRWILYCGRTTSFLDVNKSENFLSSLIVYWRLQTKLLEDTVFTPDCLFTGRGVSHHEMGQIEGAGVSPSMH